MQKSAILKTRCSYLEWKIRQIWTSRVSVTHITCKFRFSVIKIFSPCLLQLPQLRGHSWGQKFSWNIFCSIIPLMNQQDQQKKFKKNCVMMSGSSVKNCWILRRPCPRIWIRQVNFLCENLLDYRNRIPKNIFNLSLVVGGGVVRVAISNNPAKGG